MCEIMVRDRQRLCPMDAASMGDEVLYLGKLRSLRELRYVRSSG